MHTDIHTHTNSHEITKNVMISEHINILKTYPRPFISLPFSLCSSPAPPFLLPLLLPLLLTLVLPKKEKEKGLQEYGSVGGRGGKLYIAHLQPEEGKKR